MRFTLALAVAQLFAPRLAGADLCGPLPPPAGAVVEVTPAQAAGLRQIVIAAAAGTTILLHDGLYDMSQGDAVSRLVFATPGVTLRSLSGHRDGVVLDGGYLTDELVSIFASNVVIADLTLRRAYDHPIHISGNLTPITGVRLHNLRIVDPGQQAVKVNPIGEGWVDDGTLECSSLELTDAGRPLVRDDCYTGGIDAHRARGWVVRRNRFAGFWCPVGLSEHAVHFWKASRDTLVEENVIVDCARGIGFGMGATGDDRVYPDDPYPTVAYLGHLDGTIRNNFIAAADPDLFASEYGFDAGITLDQTRHPRVAHNSVASTVAPFSSVEWRFADTLVELANNLVSHNLRPRDGGVAQQQSNLDHAPLGWFADVAGGDLHLSALAGAAIGGGAALAAGVADFDIDRQWRPGVGAPPDVGADEFSPPLLADGFESGNAGAWSG